ncbi:MAG: molybdopterin-guanine dinucleotide biosynthesis protein B [bacterium]
MIPIISIVGRSGSGKTTLLEALIPLLRARGYRVGTVKHGSHGFHLDQEGKDSWRHAQAGAEVAAVSTPEGLGIFQRLGREKSLEELMNSYLSDMDLILAEGYKSEARPKVEVHRSQIGGGLLTSKQEGLLAVVSDVPLAVEVPLFPLDDSKPLADFLEEKFLSRREREQVQLLIDGRRIPLNPFVQDLFRSMLPAMVAPLKGIGPFSRLSLRLGISEDKGVSRQ